MTRTAGFFPAPRYARKLAPPSDFDFEKNEDGVLQWLNRAMTNSLKAITGYHKRKGRPARRTRVSSYYDFRLIKTMTPAAALVVAAFFDRHKQLAGVPIRVYDYEQWDPEVRRGLVQIGFFDLLGVDPRAIEIEEYGPRETKIERFTSQSKLQPAELSCLVDTLLGYILAANPDLADAETDRRTSKLFEALIEATENTRRHAYPDTHSGYAVLPNWWLTGFADPKERKLTLIVYDQGISMPGSLASGRSSEWHGHTLVNRIIRRFSRGAFDQDDHSTDHAKIRLAMRMGQSSTGEPHRGKGLPVVREAIKHCIHGRLRILSRSGGYLEETGKRAISWPLSSPMPGTLIIWDLQL